MHEVLIPIKPGSDVLVDWGDGTPMEEYTGEGSEQYHDNYLLTIVMNSESSLTYADFVVGDIPYHQYVVPGQYDVKLYGHISGFWITPDLQRPNGRLMDVKQWGEVTLDEYRYGEAGRYDPEVNISSEGGLFVGREYFTISAPDAPTINAGADLSGLFIRSTYFNSDISHWDTSNALAMAHMFEDTQLFNQDLSNWSVDLVTDYTDFAAFSPFDQERNKWPPFKGLTDSKMCPTPPADQWFGDTSDNTPQLYSLDAWYLTSDAIVGGTAIDVSTDCVFAFAAGGVNTFQTFETDFTPDTIVVVFQPTNNEFQFGEWDSLSLTAIGGSDRWGPQLAYVNKSRSDLESESGEPLNMDHCYRVTMDNITYTQETGRSHLGCLQFGAEYAQLRLRDVEFYKAGQRIYPTIPM